MAEGEAVKTVQETRWLAIFSLFLAVTGLVGSEFLPISLLTPMAADLGISEGMAGQTITAVGLFAVAASLLVAPLTQKADRRFILLLFSALLIVSNVMTALASNLFVLILGRCGLGLCVGGFWSLAAATVLRLAEPRKAAKALGLVFAGVSAAYILAVPLASYIGQFIGWRGVFAVSCLWAALAFICQYKVLPSMPARGSKSSFADQLGLLRTRWALLGLAATMCSFAGYYVLFTYMRPFFEQRLGLSGGSLSFALLAFSLANCFGTFIAGFILTRFLRQALLLSHIILLCVPWLLWLGGRNPAADISFAMLWAGFFGLANVGWSSWIIRTMPERAEIAGGLQVAAIQLSIMTGAALGGAIFDHSGINGLFPASSAFLCLAVFMLLASFKLFARAKGRPV
ncbi:MAG: MFS transporter [Candidatus Tokpelaia sp.]|nr:MAG: MFS transporter [Candidatus Tokpelaia sp.]KAA6206999.1 MAG: MFS transporter [Candidatus Tokpelaia sp.]